MTSKVSKMEGLHATNEKSNKTSSNLHSIYLSNFNNNDNNSDMILNYRISYDIFIMIFYILLIFLILFMHKYHYMLSEFYYSPFQSMNTYRTSTSSPSLLRISIGIPENNSITSVGTVKWRTRGILTQQPHITNFLLEVSLDNKLIEFPTGNNVTFQPSDHVSKNV